MTPGYIYLRENEYWYMYDAIKLGKTSNIPDRERTYITSEIKISIIIEEKSLNKAVKSLHKAFNLADN